MIRFKTEQTIERSADEVWDYAADIARHPEWMGVLDSRVLSGDPTQVGARGREHVKFGPSTSAVDFEVLVAIPGRRIGWRMLPGSPYVGDVILDLEPLGPDRTHAVWSGGIILTGWRRLLEPIMAREAQAGEAAELRRLKEQVEKAPAQAAATA